MNIERDQQGNVTIDNGITVQIPPDKLALNVLGTNPVINRGTYSSDGWIYLGGKRVRKWFVEIESIRIWEPKLNNIVNIEERYNRVNKRVDELYISRYQPIFEKLVKLRKAHARPTHYYTGKLDRWWEYHVSTNPDGTYYVTFDWIKKPDNIKNHELGQKFYEISRMLRRYQSYRHIFSVALDSALHKILLVNKPNRIGQTLKLVINNRNFWYHSVFNGAMDLRWAKIAYTDSDIVEVEIN